MKSRKRRKLSGAARAAFVRRMKFARRKSRTTTRKRHSTRRRRVVPVQRAHSGSVSMAKRRRHHARKNPARRRHARHHSRSRSVVRRNPPGGLSTRGIVRDLTQGTKHAVIGLGAEAATNMVSRMVPVSGMAAQIGVRAAAALVVSAATKKFLGGDAGQTALAFSLAVPIRAGIKAAGLPVVSGALAGDDEIGAYLEGVGSYLELPPGGRNVNGVGDVGDVGDGSYGMQPAFA